MWAKYRLKKMRKGIKRRRLLKLVGRIFIFGIILGLAIIGVIFAYFAKDLPNPEKISQRDLAESTKIYDRTGQVLLYDVHGEEKRTVIPFDQIPQAVKDATVVAEDDNFYHHFGLDFRGILRALVANLRGKKIAQGGSTITQQFIKNSILTPERTFSRKIKEAILAIELEIKYPKDKILEFYLNQVPYGSNAYGIESAAQTFFAKPAVELTLAESALLAALPNAPTYYSPYGSRPEELKARQEYILGRMKKFGYISQEEHDQTKEKSLSFSRSATGIKAPHFVMYIRQQLVEKYGEEYIQRAGLKIYTTLDWELQQIAQEAITKGVEKNSQQFSAFNGALVAIDPKNGQILAMVGSKNYFAEPSPKGCAPGKNCRFEPNVNVSIRERQPGSSFKPFVYAAAFQKGYTPETILFDLQTEFSTSPTEKSYRPQNYDNQFRGPVTMRQALAQSLNIPAVKTLYLVGLNDSLALAQKMGINTLTDKKRYGLSLVLGGGEVKLLEQVSAFGIFANEGERHPHTAVLKIEDKNGKILEEFKDKSEKVLEKNIALTISDLLSDNEARSPTFGSQSPLVLTGRPAAVKTGTTEQYRDAWAVGYTPSLVAGVWTGNNDNTPMKRGSGVYASAPIWNEFMTKAYQQSLTKDKNDAKPNEFFLPEKTEYFPGPTPLPAEKPVLAGSWATEKILKVDRISGKLATEFTPPELIQERAFQQVHCILYWVDKDNPNGPPPENPAQDPQFKNWEGPVLAWTQNPFCPQNESCHIYNQLAPTDYDDVHIPENKPRLEITSPADGRLILSPLINITAQASAPLGIKQLDFFFNDTFIGSDKEPPFSFSYQIPQETLSGQAIIKVRAFDSVLNRAEEQISVYISLGN